MFTFYRENGVLYVETKFDLVRPITVCGRKIEKSDQTSFEEVDLIEMLLVANANILIRKEPGEELTKPNLYDFSMALENKKYKVIDKLPELVSNDNSEIEEEVEEDIDEVDEQEQFTKSENFNNNQNQGKNRKKRNNNQNEEGDK